MTPWWRDPRSVGDEPDYRFTLANERTFLAWIRTALSLAAGGLGALALIDERPTRDVVGLILLTLSFVTAVASYRRWALNERAMRQAIPLPASRLPMVIAVGTAGLGVVGAILLLIDVQ